MKKDCGEATVVAAMICNVTGILVFTVLFLLLIDSSHMLTAKHSIYRACDRQLEQMMATGYLTDTAKQTLKSELVQLGATGIDFTGSTVLAAGYGENICLNVKFYLTQKRHGIAGWIAASNRTTKAKLTYHREATAFP